MGKAPGDSSDYHRGPGKNGEDQRQNREIRDLHSEIDLWKREEVRVHAAIEDGLGIIRDDLNTAQGTAQHNGEAIARIEGRQSSNRI